MTQYIFKIGDLPDEAHIIYDQTDPESPIRWTPQTKRFQIPLMRTSMSSPSLETETNDDDVPMGLGRRKSFLSNSRERLSLNVGTLQFMAPEMASHEDTFYNEKVDIWSFGMIIYELLTMELPYNLDRYGPFELYDIVKAGIRPKMPKGYLNTSRWTPIVELFLECTELDAKKRPSAAEIVRRLS